MILTESQQEEIIVTVQVETCPPWIVNPYALVSWLTMEKFAAEQFCRISGNIGLLAQQYANMRAEMVPSENRLSLAAQLADIVTTCESIGLKVSSLQIKDAGQRLASWGSVDGTWHSPTVSWAECCD